MNKHHHRIVFNAARGALMAVAETACSQSGGTGATNGTTAGASKRPGAQAFAVWVLTATAFAAQAQIRPDQTAPANQQATVLNAGNGVPLVNIQTPSAAGVSRNTYSQFDVQRNGAILNNSRSDVQTQLGGWVQGNPVLATGSARVILNEVNSNQPSALRGFVEVAGQRAQVVIANPAGITCDGCGFINASRTTLTTGTPVFNGLSLDAYLVRGGLIDITGAGLQTLGSDYTDLIARAVKVNAGVWANQLQVITGLNQVSADANTATSAVTKLGASQATDSAPAFAIDTAQMGGMYAGKIVLVGTESGVGVRNAGQIGASAGQLSLSNDGQVINTGQMQASGALSVVTTQGLSNQGNMSGQSTTVQASSLINTGLIDGQDTLIRANTLTNQGTGKIYGDHLSVAADQLTQAVTLINGATQAPVLAARQRLDLGVGTLLNQEQSLVFSAGDMAIGGAIDANGLATGRATLVDNRSATIEALGSLSLSAQTVRNSNEHFSLTAPVLVSSGAVEEYTPTTGHDEGQNLNPQALVTRYAPNEVYIQNSPSGQRLCEVDCIQVIATGEMSDAFDHYQYTRTISETQIATSAPGVISAASNLDIQAGTLVNDKSRIQAGQTLSVQATSVQNLGAQGQRIIEENGQVTHASRHQVTGEDHSDYATTAYNPATATLGFVQGQGTQSGQSAQARQSTGAAGTLPNSSLFSLNSTPGSGPLIETDPRFTNRQQWLSSDALLAQLAYDPATVQKRLGDGFYEQKLIREQVAQLTGRRFLEGFASDEAQYQALIDQGATVAKALGLRPGVAISAAQAATLTSDIVWLETTTVTMPNGSSTQVLTPKVYLKPRAGDLQASGDLMGANNLTLQVSGSVINSGGMGARQVVNIEAQNLINQGGSIAARNTVVNATQDIQVQGGSLQGQQSLSLSAGQDITVGSTLASTRNTQSSSTHVDRVAGLYVSEAAGQLLLNATRDVNLQAAQVSNQGAGGSTSLVAGRDLSLGTVTTSQSQDITWNSRNKRNDSATAELGSTLQAAGDVTLQSGRDLQVRASTVRSEQGQLQASAAGQVNIEAGQTRQQLDQTHYTRKSGTLSSGSQTVRDQVDATTAQGSTLSAARVAVQAGQDLRVQGSNVVSDQGTGLQAGGDVRVEAAQQETHNQRQVVTKNSGLMGAGTTGFAIGTRKQSTHVDEASTTTVASTVGATQGSVSIEAGQRYAQVGSDVIAPQGGIAITAQQVDIDAANQTQRTQSQTKFEQTGVTVSLSTPLLNAAQTARQMSQAASQTSDSRMKVLAGAATALSAVNAVNDLVKDPTDFTVSIMLGRSTSQSQTVTDTQSVRGSQVVAGQDITVLARAAGGNAETGLRPVGANDITVRGSTLQAGGNVALEADRDVNLLAAQNTLTERSTNSSSSASIGVKLGTKEKGVAVGASQGKGSGQGDEVTYTNARVSAGQQLSITSGADTTLKGAMAKGEQVVVNVGGQLNLQSLQDTSTYESRQQNVSGGLTLGPQPGGNAAYSQSRTDANFASVGERTGIQAGDQGFQVNVAGKTELQGAVIASTDKAVQDGKNTLNTQSLTTSDIQNQADFKAQAVSVSVGTSAGQSSAGFGQASGKASSTTTAGVSGIAGDASVRTGDKQQGINAIFDNDKVSKDVNAQVAITSTFGQQAAKAVGDYGQSKTKPVDEARERQALDKLAETGSLSTAQQARLDALTKQGMSDAQAIANLADPSLLKDYGNWKEGGAYRVAAHTAVGALAGGISGALGSGITAATMPSVADAINDLKLPEPIRQAVIAATGTVIGATVGGTAGAVSGFSQTTNNFLVHQQVDALRKDLAKCQSKSNGCSDADVSAIVKTYRDLSNQNIAKVQSCINQGDTACVQKLEGQAASAGELSGVLPLGFGAHERQLQDRQTNVTLYGSVKGNASMFGTDLEQARQVSQFRQDHCTGVNASTCDGLVQQALADRMKRVGVLMAVGTLTPLAVRELTTLRIPSVKGSASKLSANEFTMQADKASLPVKVDGTFETVGLKRDPLTFPDGVKMVQSLQKTGLTLDEAIREARSFINSGATPPVATPLDVTDKLVKVVPAGGQPSTTTGYWMRESELTKLQQDPATMANRLGLPPGMQVDKFDVYQIVPRQGAMTYESTIAPTKVDGVANTTGGAKQTIVLDRTQFTPPVKTGSIDVTKRH
jgi:filamentous hemagglutinin